VSWLDNIKTWTGLPVEESVRMTEINGERTSIVWPTLGSRVKTAKDQNRTDNILEQITLTESHRVSRVCDATGDQ